MDYTCRNYQRKGLIDNVDNMEIEVVVACISSPELKEMQMTIEYRGISTKTNKKNIKV
jgi:acylphosphatase